ncbi:hypothetical protein ACLOJK_000521 [Asimina triloba]
MAKTTNPCCSTNPGPALVWPEPDQSAAAQSTWRILIRSSVYPCFHFHDQTTTVIRGTFSVAAGYLLDSESHFTPKALGLVDERTGYGMLVPPGTSTASRLFVFTRARVSSSLPYSGRC